MSKLDSEGEILKLAAGLKVDWQQNAVQNFDPVTKVKQMPNKAESILN